MSGTELKIDFSEPGKRSRLTRLFRVGSRCAICLAWLLMFGGSVGCESAGDPGLERWVAAGDFGRARAIVREGLTHDRADRRYLLDRVSLAILSVAEGDPASAQGVFEQVYEVLRTQGLNRDQTVASVVLNEDLKFWKGEPFEQAMALFYYGLQQAMLGQWDNARAAAGGSLFQLRDFGTDEATGERIDTLEITRRAMLYEQAREQGEGVDEALGKADAEDGDYLNSGYAVRDSDFALGYLLKGIAAQQLGRLVEAQDHYAVAVRINQELKTVCDPLVEGKVDTILVVGYGLGPRKVGYGPDQALGRFEPRVSSDGRRLSVSVGGDSAELFPVVCDLNRMAADHMWNNLEDIRLAKSHLGTALLYGGGIAAHLGSRSDSDTAVYAGLGAMAAGVFLKAGAHVDTRYCDVLPQRVFVVPIAMGSGGARAVEMIIEGEPGSKMALAGLVGPPDGGVQLRYVRLVSGGPDFEAGRAPEWASRGEVVYSNNQTGAAGDDQGPYILGGRCVRPPSAGVLGEYQRSGWLTGSTPAELEGLYRTEGVRWGQGSGFGPAVLGVGPGKSDEDARDRSAVGARWQHVLEGGTWMYTPLAGTSGFARLFGQIHGPYRPRSDWVKTLFRAPEE